MSIGQRYCEVLSALEGQTGEQADELLEELIFLDSALAPSRKAMGGAGADLPLVVEADE